MTGLKIVAALLALANVGYYLWVHGPGGAPFGPTAAPATGTLRLASEVAGEAGASSPPVPVAPLVPGTAIPASASESEAASIAAGAAAPGATHQDSAELLTNVKRCVSVGPFRDVAEAAHAAATLRAGGYDPRQRVAEGDVWAGVWVYLAVPAARAAEEQMLAKLRAGGLDDVLEMPGPNDAPVVSLGLYSEPQRAQARVAQAQSLGFTASLADRKRTGNVYWIDIDLKPTDAMLDPSELRGESGRIMRLEVRGCPPVGSPS